MGAFEHLDSIAKGAHPNEATIRDLGEVLRDMDSQLQRAVCEEQAKIDNASADEAMRIEAQVAAESAVAELEKSLSDARSAQTRATGEAREAKDRIANAQSEHTKTRTELKVLASKRKRLESAKLDLEPLSDTATSEAGGKKRLTVLHKVGNEFGFHEVLLTALPAVLKKPPSRRQTFDNLTLRQLEVEFTKHNNKANVLLREGEVAVEASLAAVKEVENAALAAVELQNANAQAYTEAKKALGNGKKVAAAARAHVRAFSTDMQRTKLCLERRIKQLSTFRSGPLAAFDAMRSEEPFDQKDKVEGANEDLRSDEHGGTTGHAGRSTSDDDGKEGSKAGTSLCRTVLGEIVQGHTDKLFREPALAAKPVCELGAGKRDGDDCSEAGASRQATTHYDDAEEDVEEQASAHETSKEEHEQQNDLDDCGASDAAAETGEWKCGSCALSAAELWRQEGTEFWFCAACWESDAGEAVKEEVHAGMLAEERFRESAPVITPVREVGAEKRDDDDTCCETVAASQAASHTPDVD